MIIVIIVNNGGRRRPHPSKYIFILLFSLRLRARVYLCLCWSAAGAGGIGRLERAERIKLLGATVLVDGGRCRRLLLRLCRLLRLHGRRSHRHARLLLVGNGYIACMVHINIIRCQLGWCGCGGLCMCDIHPYRIRVAYLRVESDPPLAPNKRELVHNTPQRLNRMQFS